MDYARSRKRVRALASRLADALTSLSCVQTVIALLGVLAAIGVPGAAALSTGVQLAGVVPLLTPLLALFETTAPMFAHLV